MSFRCGRCRRQQDGLQHRLFIGVIDRHRPENPIELQYEARETCRSHPPAPLHLRLQLRLHGGASQLLQKTPLVEARLAGEARPARETPESPKQVQRHRVRSLYDEASRAELRAGGLAAALLAVLTAYAAPALLPWVLG